MTAVLKVSVKEGSDSESSVTVRLYGPNTDLVIDRERELQVSASIVVYANCLCYWHVIFTCIV